jgi:hypothetical protein
LFVTVEDEFGGGFVQFVKDRQDRAAGISEHDIHLVLLDQHFVEDFAAAFAFIAGFGTGGGRFGVGLQRGHGFS